MAGVASDVTTAWTIKQPAVRTNVNLDLTTAVALAGADGVGECVEHVE
jgi:threonine synthase